LLSDHVGSSLVDHILPCLGQLHADTEELVNIVAEIISEVREPITSVEKEISKADRRDLDKKVVHWLWMNLKMSLLNVKMPLVCFEF